MTAAQFKSESQGKLFAAVRAGLEGVGYRGQLLETDYGFGDVFIRGKQATSGRTAPLAAFGRLPATYETACFSVLLPNGVEGVDLVQQYKSLGAPLAFEVRQDRVHQWL